MARRERRRRAGPWGPRVRRGGPAAALIAALPACGAEPPAPDARPPAGVRAEGPAPLLHLHRDRRFTIRVRAAAAASPARFEVAPRAGWRPSPAFPLRLELDGGGPPLAPSVQEPEGAAFLLPAGAPRLPSSTVRFAACGGEICTRIDHAFSSSAVGSADEPG